MASKTVVRPRYDKNGSVIGYTINDQRRTVDQANQELLRLANEGDEEAGRIIKQYNQFSSLRGSMEPSDPRGLMGRIHEYESAELDTEDPDKKEKYRVAVRRLRARLEHVQERARYRERPDVANVGSRRAQVPKAVTAPSPVAPAAPARHPLAGTEYEPFTPESPTTATQRVLGRVTQGALHGALPVRAATEAILRPLGPGPSLEPHSAAERVVGGGAELGANILGFTAGLPGKLLRPFTAAIPHAQAGAGFLSRIVSSGARAGVEGSVYSMFDTVVNDWDRFSALARKNPAAAVVELQKRAGITAAEWALMAGGASEIIRGVSKGLITARDFARARSNPMPGVTAIPAHRVDRAAVARGEAEIDMTNRLMSTYGANVPGEAMPRLKIYETVPEVAPVANVPRTRLSETYAENVAAPAAMRLRNLRAFGTSPRQIIARAQAEGSTLAQAEANAMAAAQQQATRPGIRQTLGEEKGGVALDIVTGQAVANAPLEALRLRQELRDVTSMGVLRMLDGHIDPIRWRQAVLAGVPKEHQAALIPHLDRVWRQAGKETERVMARAAGELPGLTNLVEAFSRGESGAEWHPIVRRELPGLIPPGTYNSFVAYLGLTAKGTNIKSNVSLAVKAFLQERMGLPAEGLLFADREVARYRSQGMTAASPKLHDFDLALTHKRTPQETEGILQGAMRGEPVFDAGENVVVMDRRMMKMFYGANAPEVPNSTEYATGQQRVREMARLLTLENWKRIIPTQDTPALRVAMRVTPNSVQARLWVAIGDDLAAAAKAAGKPAATSENFVEYLSRNPKLMERLKMGMPRLAPAWAETPVALSNTVATRRYAIFTPDAPHHPVVMRKTKGGTEVPKYTKPGEDPHMAVQRMLAEDGFTAEQVMKVRGRSVMPDGTVHDGEVSYMVVDMPPQKALKYMKDLGQGAVVTNEGVIFEGGAVSKPLGGIAFYDEAVTSPWGHSVIDTPAGPLPFSIKFEDEPSAKVNIGKMLRGAAAAMREALVGTKSEVGAVSPEGTPRITLKFNQQTGKFETGTGAEIPPSLRNVADLLSQQVTPELQTAQVRHTLRTGQPMVNTSLELEFEPARPGGKPRQVKTDAPLGVKMIKGWQVYVMNPAAEIGSAVKITGIRTQERNILGNTFGALTRPMVRGYSGAIDYVLSGGGTLRPRERYVTEAWADAAGMFGAMGRATRNLVTYFKLDPSLRPSTMEGGAEMAGPLAAVAKVTRQAFRPLKMMDEFFKEVNRAGVINAHSWRQALAEGKTGEALVERATDIAMNPALRGSKVQAQIEKEVLEAVYQDPSNKLAELGQSFRKYIPGGRILFPFIQIAANGVRFVWRHGPGGLFEAAGASSTGEMVEGLARTAVGASFSAVAAGLAMNGLITGIGPSNMSTRRQMMANGWQPESIKIGGKWVSYRGYEPFASYLRLVSSGVESLQTDEEWLTQAGRISKAAAEGFLDNTFISQAKEIMDTLFTQGDFVKRAERFGTQVAVGYIPTLVKDVSRTIDPVVRESEGFVEKIKANLPGVSQQLRPRLDPLGQPIERAGSAIERLLLPNMTAVESDPLMTELIRLGVSLPRPTKTPVYKGVKRERAPEVRYSLEAERGRQYAIRLTQLMEHPRYQSLSDEKKKEKMQALVRRVVTRSERRARRTEVRP